MTQLRTATFLFTDLERSTQLWDDNEDAMRRALARHDELIRAAVETANGRVVKTTGDGVYAVFDETDGALAAAVDAQRALMSEPWGETGTLRVRMGLHTGSAEERGGDFYGSAVNRAARLMSLAHPGQILVSEASAVLSRDTLASDVELRDLGEHHLRGLARAERVFQVVATGLTDDFPALVSTDTTPSNLPAQLTSFVGRDDEQAALAEVLRERSLVTLTGVGGVGKTRLAIEVATELLPGFRDGAWLCELAPVRDPDAVWETIAASLRVHPTPGRRLDDVVLEHLGPKQLLLVLDNCEHLLDAVALVVDQLGRRCASLVVLATSREGLAVPGEQIIAVRSLATPDADMSLEDLAGAEAVRLFVDRARAAKRGFVLTEHGASAVRQLCERLDGIPLAIELAAAHVRSLSPDDLVARLDQRFKLLAHGSRAALERHQTLRNTIDWSYDLLSEAECDALNRLSVFAGGCDLLAAEAVVSGGTIDLSDVADLLGQLVDKSLVVADDDGGQVRYRLLETIRQYAQERLDATGDAADVRRRHTEHFVEVAEEAGPRLRSREQIAIAHVVWRDADNFRAALDWAIETASADHAMHIVAPLAVFGTRIGYATFGWAEAATDIPGASEHPLFPAVASWAGLGISSRGDLERATALDARVEAAEVAFGHRALQTRLTRATLGFYRGDMHQARRESEAAVAIARSTGEPYDVAQALTILATATGFSDVDFGVATADEAVCIARDAGVPSVLSTSLVVLAMVLSQDDAPRAIATYDESAEVAQRIGDDTTMLTSITGKAVLAARFGEYRAALRASADAAQEQLRAGHVHVLYTTYWAAALSFVGFGRLEPAAVLVGTADADGRRPVPEWAGEMSASVYAALLEGLGEERLATLLARGAAMNPADAVAYLRTEAERVLSLDVDP